MCCTKFGLSYQGSQSSAFTNLVTYKNAVAVRLRAIGKGGLKIQTYLWVHTSATATDFSARSLVTASSCQPWNNLVKFYIYLTTQKSLLSCFLTWITTLGKNSYLHTDKKKKHTKQQPKLCRRERRYSKASHWLCSSSLYRYVFFKYFKPSSS